MCTQVLQKPTAVCPLLIRRGCTRDTAQPQTCFPGRRQPGAPASPTLPFPCAAVSGEACQKITLLSPSPRYWGGPKRTRAQGRHSSTPLGQPFISHKALGTAFRAGYEQRTRFASLDWTPYPQRTATCYWKPASPTQHPGMAAFGLLFLISSRWFIAR